MSSHKEKYSMDVIGDLTTPTAQMIKVAVVLLSTLLQRNDPKSMIIAKYRIYTAVKHFIQF